MGLGLALLLSLKSCVFFWSRHMQRRVLTSQRICRECGERLDIWIVRFAWKRPLHFHGLTRTKGCTNVSDAMTAARSVWFMNGEAEHERDAVRRALLNLTHLQARPTWLSGLG